MARWFDTMSWRRGREVEPDEIIQLEDISLESINPNGFEALGTRGRGRIGEESARRRALFRPDISGDTPAAPVYDSPGRLEARSMDDLNEAGGRPDWIEFQDGRDLGLVPGPLLLAPGIPVARYAAA